MSEIKTDAIELALFNNNPEAVREAERQLRALCDEIRALRARVAQEEAERRAGAQAMLDMLSALYPGFDRQGLDSVFRALQDKYGSPAAMLDRAARESSHA